MGQIIVATKSAVTLAGAQTLSNKTLTSAILGNTLNANSQQITNCSIIGFADGAGIYMANSSKNSSIYVRGGTWGSGTGGMLIAYGHSSSTPGAVEITTTDAAGGADSLRLRISGAVATSVATWANITHTGLVLTASEKIYPVSGVAGFSVVSTALTLGSLGSVIIPQSAAAATDALAGNVAGAIALDLTGAAEKLYFRGASWFYIAKTGGLSMTKEERIDPKGHKFEIGDGVALIVDRINRDGSFHALPHFAN